ncbi:hypothetical protein CERSUDRAFT_127741 [Gelatoporia subvermispora B]|uniref:Uncharacterized protein n=1 Tax=Ceriporiopsis subvermispora (strain B) TaxID=914234 RepID=M2P680_CERS8|nr:hypothetical protein CERSUDRAFT_127741 [Gelatoporia subvermispora B]
MTRPLRVSPTLTCCSVLSGLLEATLTSRVSPLTTAISSIVGITTCTLAERFRGRRLARAMCLVDIDNPRCSGLQLWYHHYAPWPVFPPFDHRLQVLAPSLGVSITIAVVNDGTLSTSRHRLEDRYLSWSPSVKRTSHWSMPTTSGSRQGILRTSGHLSSRKWFISFCS